MKKFIDNHNKFVDEQFQKFKMKYGVYIDVQLNFELRKYFTMVYYKKIEKRGYRVIDIIRNKEI